MQPSPAAGTVTVGCSVFSVQWSAQEPVLAHPAAAAQGSCREAGRQRTDNGGRCQCYLRCYIPFEIFKTWDNKNGTNLIICLINCLLKI